jgi:hypothetical protein
MTEACKLNFLGFVKEPESAYITPKSSSAVSVDLE